MVLWITHLLLVLVAFNSNIYSLGLLNDGSIIVSGAFYTFSGITNNYKLVALNSDGTLNNTLNPNLIRDFNQYVYDIHVQSDGKIILGGDFNIYNNTSYNGIVRLNSDLTVGTIPLLLGQVLKVMIMI